MAFPLAYSIRQATPTRLIVVSVVLAVLIGAAVLTILLARPRMPAVATGPKLPEMNMFYGRVVDQDGVPIVDANVTVLVSEIGENTLIPGGTVLVPGTQKRYSVPTGTEGEFMLQLESKYQVLQIEDIAKPGYAWVKDWIWTVSGHGHAGNTAFRLRGPRKIGPVYTADPVRPAVFPMHEIGNTRPASRPFRGGSDDGRKNEPVELVIPTAGPEAPATPEEADRRIVEHFRELNEAAGHRAGPRDAVADLSKIKTGMEEDAVRRIAGNPTITSASRGTGEPYWVYYVQGEEPGSVLMYTVHFRRDGEKLIVKEVRTPDQQRKEDRAPRE